MASKARVKAGRLVGDEPTDLPEGTEIEILPLDPGDWLDEEDRAALREALSDAEEDVVGCGSHATSARSRPEVLTRWRLLR